MRFDIALRESLQVRVGLELKGVNFQLPAPGRSAAGPVARRAPPCRLRWAPDAVRRA